MSAPLIDLREHVAIITGSSRGIGRAIAETLARAGMQGANFDWRDPLRLDSLLTPEEILIRDTEDALTYIDNGKTGGINVIDLANINSCAFIATQDLGKKKPNNSFEVLGRFDHSDIRGCNLMVL